MPGAARRLSRLLRGGDKDCACVWVCGGGVVRERRRGDFASDALGYCRYLAKAALRRRERVAVPLDSTLRPSSPSSSSPPPPSPSWLDDVRVPARYASNADTNALSTVVSAGPNPLPDPFVAVAAAAPGGA